MKLVDRVTSITLPAGISEKAFTQKRDIDVDYGSLDYEIHIATLNEENYIEETLESLVSQDPVKRGDVQIVLIDSSSNDETVIKARPYVDDVIQAPRGLLTARNRGVQLREPDVVLSADAGDIYSPGWVDELAKPFENDNVVAAYGNIYSKDPLHMRKQKIKHSIVNLWNLPGNNSAIRTSALKETGMFDESIDQTDLVEMVLEEQIFKKIELSMVGDVSYRPYAAIYKSQRRKERTTEDNKRYKQEQYNGDRF